jgi:ubiquinone biosynthesis protein
VPGLGPGPRRGPPPAGPPTSLLRPPARLRLGRLARIGAVALHRGLGLWRAVRPGRRGGLARLAARQVRLGFEDLGPSFVKLGQLVSSSPGAFPAALVEELSHLQDEVAPEPWEAVAATLGAELGPAAGRLRWVGRHPLAAASMAQVHPAVLEDGAEVVVKVQRPGLAEVLGQDLRAMHAAARLVSRALPAARAANPVGAVEDFARTLAEELDFRVEAGHMERLREILAGWPVAIPRVVPELTSARVLTMSRLEGTKISDTEALARLDVDRVALADTVLASLLYTALCHGIFHGDAHPGNLLVLEGGVLGLLDFGIVGQLDDRTRIQTARLVAAFVDRRFEAVAEAIVSLAHAPRLDVAQVVADLSEIAASYLSRPWGQVRLPRLLLELVRAATRHGVVLPADLVLFCKQLLYLDGVGRALNPSFDVFADGSRFLAFLPPEAR